MPAAVRRRRAAAVAAAGVALALTGCAGIGQPAPYDSPGINGLVIPTPQPRPGDFVDAVDNPWLALEPGATWHYDVTGPGGAVGTIDAEVLNGTTAVAGLGATGVRTTTEIGGDSSEQTVFYAQDEDGNVWVVGADTPRGDWRAGEDGAEAGLAMPAFPRLGDGWVTYVAPGLPPARTQVEDQSLRLVQTRDEAGTATRNVYEKGAGLVSVEDLDAGWTASLSD